jgi:hypothetical protein
MQHGRAWLSFKTTVTFRTAERIKARQTDLRRRPRAPHYLMHIAEQNLQGHMIAFRAAMTRHGDLKTSQPTIVSWLAALCARFEDFAAHKSQ